ncbi:MAG TPA: hypothetical protein VGV92_03415 [Gammaproteobacteria bacterium]|nr:hypothetical protein [Gammaproteobacteria bacterium]
MVKSYPFFHGRIFSHLTKDVATLRRQVSEWIQKGYVVPLKRGMYTLQEKDRETKFSKYYLANQLYLPSYISLETALSYYNIIPEGVYATTSISSKKTQEFNNALGQFIYHHVEPNHFGDFVMVQDEFKNSVYMASKERAIIDFLYFRVPWEREYKSDIFTESYRFQNLEGLDTKKLRHIAKKYKINKMTILVNLLIKQLEHEHD